MMFLFSVVHYSTYLDAFLTEKSLSVENFSVV